MRTPTLMLLAVASCGKTDGWFEVGRVGAGVLYTDSATIVRTGTSATGLALLDFRSPQSTKGAVDGRQHEYDCSNQQWRILSIAYYSGNMGGGDMISTTVEPGGWMPAAPSSTGITLWDAPCGKS